MTNLENKMAFQPTHALLWFYSEDFEDDYDYLEVLMGYELDNALKLYYNGKVEQLFDNIYHAQLIRIEYFHYSTDIAFRMSIGMDDSPNIELSLNTNNLQDSNAKRLSLIRDIINFDSETENVLLKELVENYC